MTDIPETNHGTGIQTSPETAETLTFTLEEGQSGRADKVLCTLLDISRNRSRELIEQGRVLLQDTQVKPKTDLKPGQTITVHIPPEQSLDVLPEDMDLDIVYEDSDIIVINKPSGLVVHPAPGHVTGTLVNGLLAHCTDLSGINGVMRPGIVHRIDKDTSGLLVVAKNDLAHQSLADQLAKKTAHREYRAIVHHPFPHTHGTINAPIGRDEKDRQSMAVTAKNAKPAVTHFEVLENFKNYAYVLCRLETGRTHQIRVHMKCIGHPVAGDPKYGPRKTLESHGQLLHASALELDHPRTGEHMRFEAPLEPEFAAILHDLETEVIQ